MKITKGLTIAILAGATLTTVWADDATNAPSAPPLHHAGVAGRDSALQYLLAPKALASLNLTADQKALYDNLEVSFKKDATKWNAENPEDPEAYQKAKESGDKEALRQLRARREGLMDIRKGYIEKLRAALTSDQKETLDKLPFTKHVPATGKPANTPSTSIQPPLD